MRDGNVGLVVLGSIAGGLGAGVVLDLLVFGGRSETTITGLALISLAFGFALLAGLSTWRTSQPQLWAVRPAIGSAVVGTAVALAHPGNRALEAAGWLWPVLLFVMVIWMARAARRSLQSWSRLTLLYPAFALLALVAVGGAYESVAGATTHAEPTSGRLYAVNGHSLYMYCTGVGTPTVILFNGLGERASSWSQVQRNVAGTTRVCAFDRAGEGWSDPPSGPQDGRELAADLHALLAAGHVRGPYVLAGHSVGGTYALVYAQEYPRQVTGMTLIDSASPYQFDLRDYPSFYSMWRRVSALFPTTARAGITRALGFGSPGEVRANHDEFTELPAAFTQAQALTTLGSKPLVVLTADRGQQTGWPAAQDKLAHLSSNRAHHTVHGATHAALLDDHAFARVTSMGIKAVVVSARTGVGLTEATG